MRVVPYQQILEQKFQRQKELIQMGAVVHANGHCFHTGRLSFGCRDCYSGEQSINLFHGTQCMCHCPYCYYHPTRAEIECNENTRQQEIDLICYKLREFENYHPAIVSLCSSGETLLYIDLFEQYAKQIYPLLYQKQIRPYTFAYTNGILADEAMLERLHRIGVNELRFHWSASDFSEQVRAHMKLAGQMGFVLTVEEPAYPKNRDALFSHLQDMEELGVEHLDLVELHLTEYNWDALEKLFPGGEALVYKDFFYHLYDGGMTYDIMEECLKKGYHFSVLDCNSGVERCRNNQDQDVGFSWDSIDGMCDDWNCGPGFVPRMRNGRPYPNRA